MHRNTPSQRSIADALEKAWRRTRVYWRRLAILGGALAALFAVFVFAYSGLHADAVVIDPISVPDALAAQGYTDVVSMRRLRDDIADYVDMAQSSMKAQQIGLQDEQLIVTVPKTGISSDTVTQLLDFLHLGNRKTVSGEFTFSNGRLALVLRLKARDAEEILCCPQPTTRRTPDELLRKGALALIRRFEPYYIAAIWHRSGSAAGLRAAEDIIDRWEFERPAGLREDAAYAYIMRGLYQYDRHRYADAEASYHKALSVEWNLPIAYVDLSNLYDTEDREDASIESARYAAVLDPSMWLAYADLGLDWDKERRYDLAERAYSLAIMNGNPNPAAYCRLARSLSKEGNSQEAARAMAVAERKKVVTGDQLLRLGRCLVASGDYDVAIADYNATLNGPHAGPEIRAALGDAFYAKGLPRAAIAQYRLAIEEVPARGGELGADIRDRFGELLQLTGRPYEAIAQYEIAIRDDSGWAQSHLGLAHACEALQRYDCALKQYLVALDDEPEWPTAYKDYGDLLLRLHRYPQAAQYLRHAVALYPHDERAQQLLGAALESQVGR